MTRKIVLSIAAVVAAAGALMAAPAEARTGVSLSIGVPLGYAYPGYGYAQPGYVAPGYVYAPAPSYVYAPPAYYAPRPVYVGPRYGHGYYGRRDRDHDGVPDRFDRRPYNPRRF